MTVANIHLLQLAPTPSPHSLFQPLHAICVSLICFIPSNLASAVPSVPLLAVCVWKTEGCVCLGMCWGLIQSDVSLFWVVVCMMCFLCSCVSDWALCVSKRFSVIDSDGNVAVCVRLRLFWVFGSWLLGQSHLSEINCVTEIAKDLMVPCISC